ncbi:MAG: type II toxin-antitoxin system VapB family antitoxin [Syntrophobacteraceae bacterium]|nr:type II toxin-antitoxin system VapB family antitoxin [Syntrophobacteraceae bacterium]
MQTTKVFRSGNSQAIRLPREFRMSGSEVYIKKMGNGVVIIPKDDPWQMVEASIDKFTRDIFEGGREQSPPQERENL